MKKENEKLQKATNKVIKNVSGGTYILNKDTGKYDIYDNETGQLIYSDVDVLSAAIALDFDHNNKYGFKDEF